MNILEEVDFTHETDSTKRKINLNKESESETLQVDEEVEAGNQVDRS
jgi:hypothetical protein